MTEFLDFKFFDSSPDLLDKHCFDKNYKLWPILRVIFLRALTGKLYYQAPVLNVNEVKSIYAKYTKFLSIFCENVLTKKRYRQLIYTTGLGNYEEDNFIQDRLVDGFYQFAAANTIVLQSSMPSNYRQRKFKFLVKYDGTQLILSELYFKVVNIFKKKIDPEVHEMVRVFISLCLSRYGVNFNEVETKYFLAITQKFYRMFGNYVKMYENYFEKLGVEYILLEEGHYGGKNAAKIIAARRLGIVSAEFQHGAVFPGHEAYNIGFGEGCESIFAEYVPDYFLSYGEWWERQMKTPSKLVTIGNPALDRVRNIPHPTSSAATILVLGDGLETQKYLDLANEIAEICSHRVIFRPHPLEKNRISHFTIASNVEIDSFSDFFHSISRSDVLISELSTGLFEAVGVVDRIFVWRTEKSKAAFRNNIFEEFQSPNDLAIQLQSPSGNGYNSLDVNKIWKNDWRVNYREFLLHIGYLSEISQ